MWVVHRDAHLLVLYKPPGLATTSPDDGPCLVAVANALDPDAPRIHPSSRLDIGVSGMVTFARTREATKALLDARAEGRYRRQYLALSATPPVPDSGTWAWPIALDPTEPRRRKVAARQDRGAREASTDYAMCGHVSQACLLRMWPRTGRTHQLRVHARHAGLPLLGDVHYGGLRRVVLASGRVLTARRVMLHCTALELPDVAHPPRAVRFCVPPPDDMAELWTGCGGDGEVLRAAAELGAPGW